MTEILSIDELKSRIAERSSDEQAERARRYRYVRPLSDAADGLIEYITNPEDRFVFGLGSLDVLTRGIGRGELCYLTGRAHSGKTQLVIQSIVNNPERRILFFTFDEVAELVLTKLVAAATGEASDVLEASIKRRDMQATGELRRLAAHTFSNLIVIDEPLSLQQMSDAVQEAEQWWGARCDLVVIDYLELLPGDQDAQGVDGKSKSLKLWTKKHQVPVICLHQASRASGGHGSEVGMSSMRYGGETEATFVLGVWRKRDSETLDPQERWRNEDTITVSLSKNKRPPCKKGTVDFHLAADTGRITEMRDDPPPASPPHELDRWDF